MERQIPDILKKIPTRNGVYIMKDEAGTVLYIGKARNLKRRVHSYFNNQDKRFLIQVFRPKIADIEWIETLNEKEALILENRLIKANQPRYNIKLRDDKTEYCLRINTRHPWPRIEIVRLKTRRDEPGVKYFGPYSSANAARQLLEFMQQTFRLRTCSETVFRTARRSCLEYDIGRCPAPCANLADEAAYHRTLQEALDFLGGKNRALLSDLKQRRLHASRKLHFEEAAALHKQIQAIEHLLEKQAVAVRRTAECDALACALDGGRGAAAVVRVREALVCDVAVEVFEEAGLYGSQEELLEAFLLPYYERHAKTAPRLMLAPIPPAAAKTLETALRESTGAADLTVRPPRSREEKALVELGNRNALSRLQASTAGRGALEEIGARLGLARPLRTIACLDISHLAGTSVYGALVFFTDAEPDKSRYRVYKLDDAGADDLKNQAAVISRLIERHRDKLPDLLLLDGGRTQLFGAREVLARAGVRNLDLAAVVKSGTGLDRVLRADGAQADLGPEAHALLMRARDEAHRFGLKHSSGAHIRRTIRSGLDTIGGIGPARRQKLLERFGSQEGLKAASREELEGCGLLPAALAQKLYKTLHEK